jgi:hypothetical protein
VETVNRRLPSSSANPSHDPNAEGNNTFHGPWCANPIDRP